MAFNAIFYFHGYNSTGNSRTSTIIRDSYPNHDIISPAYNTKDAYLGVKECIDPLILGQNGVKIVSNPSKPKDHF